MGAKWAFRLAVIAAIAMLAIATLMSVAAPPCNPLPMSTLTAFELVRTDADLQRIFGDAGAACRVDLVLQLDHANLIDSVAYIPAYAAFYALVLYALGRRDRVLGWIGVVIVVVCALADWVENYSMFQLSAWPSGAAALGSLQVSTEIKWVGLAVATTIAGVMLARRGGFGWAALVPCTAPLVTSLWSLAAPDAAGQYLIPGMTIASVMLLAVGVVGSFRNESSPPRPVIA